MPRPSPLENLATGRPRLSGSDYRSLTPRTPHSRSGRAEEALDDIELENYADDQETDQHQSEPLLASSTSASFPPSGIRSRGDDYDLSYWKGTRVFQLAFASFTKHIPLVIGIVVAFILFVMIVISFRRPEVLLRVIGETNRTINDTSQQEDLSMPSVSLRPNPLDPYLITYDNYTNFPLLATEYLAECNKLMGGFMHHGAYWANKQKDVPHREQIDEHGLPEGFRNAICNSTITYMLSGSVGLLADLALMSQVAALAREVRVHL